MENLGLRCFEDIYRGKNVFITGHTGFKGSWLSLWLTKLGANVTGFSLPLDSKSIHYENLHLPVKNYFGDINHYDDIATALYESQPDIVFHLAAQSLVRDSYYNPIKTFQTNVIGSLNVYKACTEVNSIKSLIAITTDKVYQNNEWCWGYRETDRLGGNDPYSASKACMEIMSESFRKSFLSDQTFLLATVRAGNVIGGGDWADDRLIPDLMRSYQNQQILKIRNPSAIRPWQHVLEPIAGYLLLGQKLLHKLSNFSSAWNFGPDDTDAISVSELLEKAKKYLPSIPIEFENSPLHEAKILKLDCSKAKAYLGWISVWNVERAIEKTVEWYKAFIDKKELLSDSQLFDYMNDAKSKNAIWVQ